MDGLKRGRRRRVQASTASLDGNGGVDLGWTDNANNETGFIVERKGGSDADFVQIGTANADATVYHDSGLTASTSYTYRVRSTNASGDSPNSNEASATTQAAPPPPPPYLKSVNVSSDLVVGGASTNAVVQLSRIASTPTIVSLTTSSSSIVAPASVTIPAGQLSATISIGTQPSQSIQVAYIYARSGDWEQKAKVVCILDTTQLGTIDVTAQSGTGGVWLSWSGPEEDVYGNSAKGYRVYRKDSSGVFVDLGQDLGAGQSFVDTTANAGTTYTYRVSLVDSNSAPVISSQDTMASATSGVASLSWQSPPAGTVQGTLSLSLSNPTNQENFNVYVDGAPFGVASTADTQGGSSTALIANIDTTSLSNGQHTVLVCSDADEESLYRSNEITITTSNTIRQTFNDGTTMLETKEHCEIRAKTDGGADTITLTDQANNVVRSWSGDGPDADVTWDGTKTDGNYAGDGVFDVNISTGNPSTNYFSQVQGNSYRPKFLAMITVEPSSYPEYQVDYAKYVRVNLQRLNENASYLASRYLVMTITEGTPIARSWGPKIKDWIKRTAEGLLVDGHGYRPAPGVTKHTVEFGDLRIRNYPGKSSGTNINVPTLLNGRQYHFVYLDTCHSIGGNKNALTTGPSDPWRTYMTTQPHDRWASAFNINYNDGVFIGNNGQTPFNGPGNLQSSSGAVWRAYRYNFWKGLGGSVFSTYYSAIAALPSYCAEPNPRSQWNYNGSIYYKTFCAGDYSF